MLSKSAIDLAFPTAQALAAKNVVLAGPGEDPITELANISLADLPVALETNPDMTDSSVVESIYEASKRQDESLGGINGCRHDVAVEELRSAIVQTVKATIATARAVAIPLINDCADAAKELLNQRANDELYPFTIITYRMPEMVLSPVLQSMIENHRNYPVSDYNFLELPLSIDGDPITALVGAAATGIERYDAELHKWVSENVDRATSIFNAFTKVRTNLYQTLNLGDYRSGENATYLYLLARKLMTDGPLDGMNIDLQEWRAYISGVAASCAAAINQVMAKRQRELNAKQLVLSWPSLDAKSGQFVLNADLVEQWCNEGGDIESIYGAHFANRDYSYDGLLKNKEVNVAEWARQRSFYQKLSANNLSTQVRTAMYEAIQPRVAAQYPSQVTSARLHELCEAVTPDDTVDLYKSVRKIICAAVYENTDVLTLLELFDEAGLQNPEADNRTVALVAVTRYVGRWLSTLLSPHAVAA